MKLSWLLVLGFWFSVLNTSAQFYESGQDPASLKWQQINTPQVQVIFPLGFDSAANRLANLFGYMHQQNSEGLNFYPRKISVVLHNQSTYSNGFVTLAPRRMELYTTPPQQFTAQDWLAELALHEYRHVVQTGKINKGITKLLYPFLGQQAPGMVVGLLPRWFLEGDAVYAETMLSNSGRGRNGDFTMEIKALVNENPKLFSFEKMLLGSYKHYIPDHYHTGYFLVSGIRQKYGNQVFAKNIDFVAKYPFIPYSFGLGMKKNTGKTVRTHYKEIFSDLEETQKLASPAISKWSVPNPKIYTSWNYPVKVADNTLFAVKSGMDDLKKFILIDAKGKEQTLFIPGTIRDSRLSVADGKIAWAEEIPDKRWSNRTYSCINVYNIKTQNIKRLTNKTRYFAASLSADTKRIATIEVNAKNESSLLILDAASGQIKEQQPAPDNLTLSDPVFSSNNHAVIIIVSGDKGKAIYQYNLLSGKWEQLSAFSFYNLSNPIQWSSYIIYSADYNGKNDLYALDSSGNIYKITHTKNGAFEPSISAKDSLIYYSDYSSQGYRINYLKAYPAEWEAYTVNSTYTNATIASGIETENFNLQDSLNNPSSNAFLHTKHAVRKYSKLGHSVNLHSWTPFYYDYTNLNFENQSVYPGFNLLSQDKLGTCVSSLSMANILGNWYLMPRLTYKGLWPIMDLSLNYGGNIVYRKPSNVAAPTASGKSINFNSLIYVPINLSRGATFTSLTPLLEINYQNSVYYNYGSKTFDKGIVKSVLGLNFYSYRKTTKRDIAPNLGFTLNTRYIFTPFNHALYGWLAYIKPRIYLPGLFIHHSLQISGAYQMHEPKNYHFSNQIPVARGYSISSAYITKSLAFDYSLPVFYPDWAMGSLLYVKRFKANLFFDLAQNDYKTYTNSGSNTYNWITQNFLSTGADFLADFHVLRIFFPITGGIRGIYLPKEKALILGPIVRVDLNY